MLFNTCCKMAGLLNSKKHVLFLTIFFLFFISVTAYGQEESVTGEQTAENQKQEEAIDKRNYQRIIPLSSDIYKEMDRLYLLAGKSRPSLARPWSADEAKKIYDGIPDKFKESNIEAATVITDEIYSGNEKSQDKKLTFRITPEINLEGHIKTNDDRKEWEHGYEERPPLLSVPLEAWLLNNLFATIDVTLKEEYAVVNETDNYLNIPSAFTEFDWYFPFRAFLSVGGEHWTVQAGRDKASWGGGATGNLMLSDYSDFYDQIRITTYWDKFKFSAIYIGLDPYLTSEDKKIDERELLDNNDPNYIENGLASGYENFREQFKAFLGHRIEFRLTNNFSLAVSEGIMFGNKYPNITQMNPIFIFHSLFAPEYSNAILSIEADYTIFKGFNAYLQFVLDDLQVPGYEDENDRPGAMGLLGGAKYVAKAGKGYLDFILEGAVTQPYLYNRWHPLTRFTNRRRIWSTYLDRYEYINKPLGYQYGPDAVVAYAYIGYQLPGKYAFALDGKVTFQGKMDSSLDDPLSYNTGSKASNLGILEGTVETEIVAGLHGNYILNKHFSIASDIYYIHINNYEHQKSNNINDFEITASVKYKF